MTSFDPATLAPEILEERKRQVEVEGWTPAHDDIYNTGVLLQAGMCYLAHFRGQTAYSPDGESGRYIPLGWPWRAWWWRPVNGSKGQKRDLVKAGALFLAERDRAVRLELTTAYADSKLAYVNLIFPT